MQEQFRDGINETMMMTMMTADDMRAVVAQMSHQDGARFLASVLGTLVIGAVLLALLYRWLQVRYPSSDGTHSAVLDAHHGGKKRRIGGPVRGIQKSIDLETADAVDIVAKRGRHGHIPHAAASLVVQRGKRLIEEGDPSQALVCFLSLLYAATDEGGNGQLPTHLPECLRGVAQCYRQLGDNKKAVRFLQAERLVYERILTEKSNSAATASKSNNKSPESIIARLLADSDTPAATGNTDESPVAVRVKSLNQIADLCSEHGKPDIALAYRVKAAALWQRETNLPLDPKSHEFRALAATLEACVDTGALGTSDEPSSDVRTLHAEALHILVSGRGEGQAGSTDEKNMNFDV